MRVLLLVFKKVYSQYYVTTLFQYTHLLGLIELTTYYFTSLDQSI